jgi:AraC-like DNA-binding protein
MELKNLFPINKIISIFYFEFSKTYFSNGESHDFWELVYVDKGEVTVIGDDKSYLLSMGQLILHKPNEFHIVKSNGVTAPNVAIVTFECNSEEMSYFFNRVFSLTDTEKAYIADIIKIGTTAFKWNDYPTEGYLVRTENALPGDEQIIRISIELILLQLYRRDKGTDSRAHLTKMTSLNQNETVSSSVSAYLKQNLSQPVTLQQISQHFGLSVSNLKKIYRTQTGTSVISTLIDYRVEEVKRLIRESAYNFTLIAEMTGFSSVHHMSAIFKRKTGMTPTEYSMSIKSRDVR